MMIGLVQPGTRRGTFLQMIGSRKMTPPRMLRMVPLGDFHISFRPNSFTRASSGVMVAHLTPTPTFLMALAASTVTWSLVLSRYSIPRSKYIRLTSRNGLISLSLMYCQMIRVISSPSSSTTGLVTLIFAMTEGAFLENRAFRAGWSDYTGPIAPQTGRRKPSRYALSAQSLACNALGKNALRLERRLGRRPRHHVPGHKQAADQGAGEAGAGPPPGEGRDHGADRQ